MFANGFPPDAEMARLTARMLLEIGAVHFRARRALQAHLRARLAGLHRLPQADLLPAVRAALMDFACAKVLRDAGFAPFDAVAGGETAGIPFAAWIAERLGLPMLYVRKKPKGFGRDAQIEGALAEGARVLLVEDLTTDGGSKLRFAEAIRTAGAEVGTPSSSSTTASSPHRAGAGRARAAAALPVHLARRARRGPRRRPFRRRTLAEVEAFLAAPLDWSAAHGGVTEVVS